MDGLHANSTYMQDTIERHLLAPAQSVVPTVVTIPSFRDDGRDEPPQEHILASLPDEPFILFVGALRPTKGVGVLLEAYRQLESPPPLVFIGTQQPDTPAFPRDVVVLRDVPHGTVMAAWGRCLFGVAPSTWPEPLGNVVHEAMSRGKAVIGTSPSGMSDMIEHEVSGLLVPAGSVSALAHAMDRLIRDVSLRERLESAARAKSADFTSERVVPRFERLYEEMIAKRAEERSFG